MHEYIYIYIYIYIVCKEKNDTVFELVFYQKHRIMQRTAPINKPLTKFNIRSPEESKELGFRGNGEVNKRIKDENIRWRCSKCKRSQKLDVLCERCLAIPPKWECHSCKKLNSKNTSMNCESCGMRRESELSELSEDREMKTPVIRKTPKTPKTPEPPKDIVVAKKKDGLWECSYCRERNAEKRNECRTCHRVKDNKDKRGSGGSHLGVTGSAMTPSTTALTPSIYTTTTTTRSTKKLPEWTCLCGKVNSQESRVCKGAMCLLVNPKLDAGTKIFSKKVNCRDCGRGVYGAGSQCLACKKYISTTFSRPTPHYY